MRAGAAKGCLGDVESSRTSTPKISSRTRRAAAEVCRGRPSIGFSSVDCSIQVMEKDQCEQEADGSGQRPDCRIE